MTYLITMNAELTGTKHLCCCELLALGHQCVDEPIQPRANTTQGSIQPKALYNSSDLQIKEATV